jgi:hypothetical protein
LLPQVCSFSCVRVSCSLLVHRYRGSFMRACYFPYRCTVLDLLPWARFLLSIYAQLASRSCEWDLFFLTAHSSGASFVIATYLVLQYKAPDLLSILGWIPTSLLLFLFSLHYTCPCRVRGRIVRLLHDGREHQGVVVTSIERWKKF